MKAMRSMTQTCMRALTGMLLLLAVVGVHAQTRAWLDRDRIAANETTTLHIETDQPLAAPDYTPLDLTFGVSGHTSSRQVTVANGTLRVRSTFEVQLQPKHGGLQVVPALTVGNARTQPLQLQVDGAVQKSASTPSGVVTQADIGAPVFVETTVDDRQPYVQQAVAITVRLFFAVDVYSGELQQDPPDGASLQQVGDDERYTREIRGRQYTVLERHYQLIPDRSGRLVLPPAKFEGIGADVDFNDLLGSFGRQSLSARSEASVLQVRPMPAQASQPWLPLHGLQLRWQNIPREARTGEAMQLQLEAVADGATAAQLPALELVAGADAQVFADPPVTMDRVVDGRPQATVTRRYTIVPQQPGMLQPRLQPVQWWDIGADRARSSTADTPAIAVKGQAIGQRAQPQASGNMANTPTQPVQSPNALPALRRWWPIIAGFGAGLLLLGVFVRRQRSHADTQIDAVDVSPAAPPAQTADVSSSRAALKAALAAGDLHAIAEALRTAWPNASTLDALRAALADPTQQSAIDALERARWGGGDAASALAALRTAFADGPRLRDVASAKPLLPPLYPSR